MSPQLARCAASVRSHAALVAVCMAMLATSVAYADEPNPDWQRAVDNGDMIYSATEPEENGYMPYVGNGYVATRIGSDTQYLAGVFNGRSSITPSHRARIPSTTAIVVKHSHLVGSALDIRGAQFLRRMTVDGCPPHVVVQQRFYAPRTLRSALVVEFSLLNATAQDSCLLQLELHRGNRSADIDLLSFDPPTQAVEGEEGSIRVTELPSSKRVSVAVVWDNVPDSMRLSGGGQTVRFGTTMRSSLDAASPSAEAMRDHVSLTQAGEALLAEHVQAWEQLWAHGLVVEGNLTVAASLNSSLYYILSSIRSDWPYGLSPGGLSTDDYNGHSFWDSETWMFPNLLTFWPRIAGSLLRYRTLRVPQAKLHADKAGYDGAWFPWESAFTGANVVPSWAPEGKYEQHIVGDIGVAFRQFWYATRNSSWLQDNAADVLGGVCRFWDSRMVRVDSGADAADGNWTVLNVQPPDESAGVVNSSVYTNAVAASALAFCLDACQQPPSHWAQLAASPYLPINRSLPGGDGAAIHAEYAGYAGQQINQADVALLQYPLEWPMDASIAAADLRYYQARTRSDGYYTGDSVYSIAWLALGSREEADAQFGLAFLHMDSHFNVWKERAYTGGNLNFITGAGGYLQNLINGYAGLRITAEGMRFSSAFLPPGGISRLTLRGVRFAGQLLDVSLTDGALSLQPAEDAVGLWVRTATGTDTPLRGDTSFGTERELPLLLYSKTADTQPVALNCGVPPPPKPPAPPAALAIVVIVLCAGVAVSILVFGALWLRRRQERASAPYAAFDSF